MDSNLLKIFVSVANEKSITKAANRLKFAQSNVTSRIKQLEKNLGFTLFHRVPKGVILTKQGEKLYPKAKEIVSKIELLTNEMKNINSQNHLIIGSTESNAVTRIISFLLQLNKNFPKTNIELFTNTTKEITKLLVNYKVDIAFISGKPKNEEFLILNKIDEQIVMIEAKNKICPNTFLSFKNGCAYNEIGQEYLKKTSQKEFKILEFGSYETILGCVKAGMGKSILPLEIVKKLNYEKDLKISFLTKSISNIPTYLVCRKDSVPKIEKYLRNYKF